MEIGTFVISERSVNYNFRVEFLKAFAFRRRIDRGRFRQINLHSHGPAMEYLLFDLLKKTFILEKLLQI